MSESHTEHSADRDQGAEKDAREHEGGAFQKWCNSGGGESQRRGGSHDDDASRRQMKRETPGCSPLKVGAGCQECELDDFVGRDTDLLGSNVLSVGVGSVEGDDG